MKTKMFITILILIIAGLAYLLLTDADVPQLDEIGEFTEEVLKKDTQDVKEDIVAVEEEKEVVTDEEEIIDDVVDEVIDDEEVEVPEEPISAFLAPEVTDEYLGSTFENNVYGYSVDFPENWYWERLEAAYLGPREDYLWLDPNSGFAEGEYPGMVHVAVLDSTLAQELQQRDDWNQSYTLTELTVDGVDATRVEYDVAGGLWAANVSIHVYIEQNGLLYEIGMFPDGQDEELLQRILSSFKFI